MEKNRQKLAAEILRQRIQSGQYRYSGLPGAPMLAKELGISYVSMREAMQLLKKSGDVIQLENGRLIPAGDTTPCRLHVLYVHWAQTLRSNCWLNWIREACLHYSCELREVLYLNTNDPAIYTACDENFDLMFLDLDPPYLLLQKLKRHKEKVVTMFHNHTRLGFRYLNGIEESAIEKLIRYASRRGCRTIDYLCCPNPTSQEKSFREIVWEKSLRKLKLRGKSLKRIYQENEVPHIAAYQFLRDVLERDPVLPDAYFCNTVDEARGALRVLADRGIQVPDEVSILAFGQPEQACYNPPRITGIRRPDMTPVFHELFEHYLGIAPSPDRMVYNIEAAHLSEDELIFAGETCRKGKKHD